MYAIKHGNITKVSSSGDTGYLWHTKQPGRINFLTLSSLLLILAAVWTGINAHHILHRLHKKHKENYSLTVDGYTFPIFVINVGQALGYLDYILNYTVHGKYGFKDFKLLFVLLVIVISGILGWCKAKSLPPLKVGIICSTGNSTHSCCLPKQNMSYSFLYMNMCCFICTLSTDIIPLLVLGYAFPVEVISFVGQKSAEVYLMHYIIRYYNLAANNNPESSESSDNSCFSKRCFLNTIFLFVVNLVSDLIGQFFGLILSTSYHNTSYLHKQITLFLPTAILAGIGYWTTFITESDTEKDKPISNDDQRQGIDSTPWKGTKMTMTREVNFQNGSTQISMTRTTHY